MASAGSSKNEIRCYVGAKFKYNFSFSIILIRSNYGFEVSCQASVPQAIVAFLESTDFVNAVLSAVSL